MTYDEFVMSFVFAITLFACVMYYIAKGDDDDAV